jgi:hypothetical protein
MSTNEEACPLCRSGHKQAGKITFTVDLGFGAVDTKWPDEVKALT